MSIQTNSQVLDEKKNIILDLDNTLIYSLPIERYKHDKHMTKAKKFKFYNMDDYYLVFERPHLQEFLTFIFENYNVSVWTAASKSYALFIIDKILLQNKPERKLDFILFSYHCGISENNTNHSKDLIMFYRNLPKTYRKSNTLIVDDNDEVYNTQPNNCVNAPIFKFTKRNSENDTFLKQLIPLLTKHHHQKKMSKYINNELNVLGFKQQR